MKYSFETRRSLIRMESWSFKEHTKKHRVWHRFLWIDFKFYSSWSFAMLLLVSFKLQQNCLHNSNATLYLSNWTIKSKCLLFLSYCGALFFLVKCSDWTPALQQTIFLNIDKCVFNCGVLKMNDSHGNFHFSIHIFCY